MPCSLAIDLVFSFVCGFCGFHRDVFASRPCLCRSRTLFIIFSMMFFFFFSSVYHG
ncbi:hypothetical protein BDV28DRAFT_129302 [Aspergillus coremiiformis]|uniref:Uncharacterized protein n=1 Tax=Aspergillus coremiiformis TaxID=138285 RepID=A0A5N6ZDN5_9EURO|nr:hypothetical protein BDV28DRAFT_129302 [Aspergillus coremiiformis]